MIRGSPPSGGRRRTVLRAGLAAAALAGPLRAANALMAGLPPDSPQARIDPNRPGSPWAGVGAVVIGDGAFGGVPLTSRHVLTAAHVVAGQAPAAIAWRINATATPRWHAVAAVDAYPGAAYPYDDLAVLTLAEPMGALVPTYALAPSPPAIGSRIRLVGYGASGRGDAGPTVAGASDIKRVGDNVIDAMPATLDTSGRTAPFFLYDFDGPGGAGPMGGRSLGNRIETCVAGGDSGSPAFVPSGDGQWLLAGINVLTAAGGPSTNGPLPPTASTFGGLGGGLLLTVPRYLDWMRERTAGGLRIGRHLRRRRPAA